MSKRPMPGDTIFNRALTVGFLTGLGFGFLGGFETSQQLFRESFRMVEANSMPSDPRFRAEADRIKSLYTSQRSQLSAAILAPDESEPPALDSSEQDR